MQLDVTSSGDSALMTLVSYAANHEDVVLWRVFKPLTSGLYIAVGAKAVREGSGTYAFYQQGWRGITLEASPYWFELLRDFRPEDTNLPMVVSAKAEGVMLYHAPDENLTTFDPIQAEHYRQAQYEVVSQLVPTITLDAVCRHYNIQHIDLLRIEVEASSLGVLQTLNLQQCPPRIIALVQGAENIEVTTYLASYSYALAYQDGFNYFYVKRENTALIDLLKNPPNQQDEFLTVHEFHLQQQVQQLQQKLAAEQTAQTQTDVANADSSVLENALWGESIAQEGIKGQLIRSNTGLRLIFARQQKLEQALWQLNQAHQALHQSHQDQLKLESERLRQQAIGFQQHLLDMEERYKQREQEWHQHSQHVQHQREQREQQLMHERELVQLELQRLYNSRSWRSTQFLRALNHHPLIRKVIDGSSAWIRFTPASRPRRTLRQLKRWLTQSVRMVIRLIKRGFQQFPAIDRQWQDYLARHPILHKRFKRLSRLGLKTIEPPPGLVQVPPTLSPKAADIYRKLHHHNKGFGQ